MSSPAPRHVFRDLCRWSGEGGPALLARKQCRAIRAAAASRPVLPTTRRRLLQAFLDRIDLCHPFETGRRRSREPAASSQGMATHHPAVVGWHSARRDQSSASGGRGASRRIRCSRPSSVLTVTSAIMDATSLPSPITWPCRNFRASRVTGRRGAGGAVSHRLLRFLALGGERRHQHVEAISVVIPPGALLHIAGGTQVSCSFVIAVPDWCFDRAYWRHTPRAGPSAPVVESLRVCRSDCALIAAPSRTVKAEI